MRLWCLTALCAAGQPRSSHEFPGWSLIPGSGSGSGVCPEGSTLLSRHCSPSPTSLSSFERAHATHLPAHARVCACCMLHWDTVCAYRWIRIWSRTGRSVSKAVVRVSTDDNRLDGVVDMTRNPMQSFFAPSTLWGKDTNEAKADVDVQLRFLVLSSILFIHTRQRASATTRY